MKFLLVFCIAAYFLSIYRLCRKAEMLSPSDYEKLGRFGLFSNNNMMSASNLLRYLLHLEFLDSDVSEVKVAGKISFTLFILNIFVFLLMVVFGYTG